jgi:rRNA maturation endonuclease Nob1
MIAQKKKPILIFDTNIFLKGIDINILKEKIYTTPEILEEIKVLKYSDKNRNILDRIAVAIEKEHLIIKKPEVEYIKRVMDSSKITGDINSLSKADIGLIGLSLELHENLEEEVVLYSNDYSIQNLCSEMNIKFNSIFRKGIKSKKIFQIFCPLCNKSYPTGTEVKYCEVCGSKLKRRPKKT